MQNMHFHLADSVEALIWDAPDSAFTACAPASYVGGTVGMVTFGTR